MVINKDTIFDTLESGKSYFFELTKDVVLDREKLVFILENYPNSKITILSGYDSNMVFMKSDVLFDEEEVKILADNINLARELYNQDITFDNMFSVEDALSASRKINSIVYTINNAKVNDEPLSPYEKFLFAYFYVTDRMYLNEDYYEDPAISRNLISVLNGDKIVCVGFANLLTTICNRLGIPCTFELSAYFSEEDNSYINHATVCVRLDDDKYNIHGIFHSDPTADRIKISANNRLTQSFTSALIPYYELDKICYHKKYIDRLVKIPDVQEVNQTNSAHHPKILSYLFPEIAQDKTQDDFVHEFAKNQISNSAIKETFVALVNKINEKDIQKDIDKHVYKILNPALLYVQALNGNFRTFIAQRTKQLLALGFSKQEIIVFFENYYTAENLTHSAITYHKKTYQNTPEFMQEKIMFSIDKILAQTKMIPLIVEKTKSQTRTDDELFDKATESFANTALKHTFSQNYSHASLEYIGLLLKRGYDLEFIKNLLIKTSNNINFEDFYIKHYLSDVVDIDEKELYSGAYPNKILFNMPYQEAYDKLVNNASGLSYSNLFNAYVNVLISQGLTLEKAKEAAKNTLNSTVVISKNSIESISNILNK